MKAPKPLNLREKEYGEHSLGLSHLSDTKNCHVMTSSYGEVTSISINKTEAKRVVNWLNRWIKFKDAKCVEGEHGN